MCLKHPGCDHGTCNRPWECLCEEGWGTCFNTGQGLYTCNCPEGYTGKQCETYLGRTLYPESASCIQLGCFNEGHCDLVTGMCQCREGYSGSRCETAGPCARQPCQNAGVCEPLSPAMVALRGGERFRCKCPLGFSGPRCETRPLDCDAKQCLNGGQCVTRNSSRVCDCINGYFGKFCENTFRACSTKPCQNFGTCIDLDNSEFKCLCQSGYTGHNCENSLRSEISRQVSENEALLLSEINGLSSLQIIIIVIISVLIPLIALIGALTVIILKRRREIERKKSDNLAKMENEANMITSGVKLAPENVMIHNMLRFGNDTKFINNFENEYATISHSVSDSFYEVPMKKPLNTNRFSKDIDKRLSRISIDSSSTSNTGGNISTTYISDSCKDKLSSCNPGPSTSNGGGGCPIYQSASSCSSMNQSIYLINADSSFQLDDSIVPPGFFATEV
ncbi:hypothetical protein B566_EDAN012660 [Ephemera danica]|nr:hypothetical protein B566_EDAN012660 [Ephemera danica]